MVGEGVRITLAPAAGKPRSSETVTSIAPAPPSLMTFPNGVSASHVRNCAPGGDGVKATVASLAAPHPHVVDLISTEGDTGVPPPVRLGGVEVAADLPF